MMQAARVAVKLEETMLTMKRLHGDRWNEVAEPYRTVLRGVMKDSGADNVLGVALQIAKGMDAKGVSPAMLMAVAAEMASTENTEVHGLRSNTVEPFVVCPNGSEKP